MGKTLLQKVWDLHTVRQLPTGQTQLFIGLHLVHEVTTPQAFDELRARGWKVARPDRTFATTDHIIPTKSRQRPVLDVMAEDMLASLERNVRDFGIQFAGLDDDRQGIVHVIGPELGLTQPGMTIACGDSHTSTHGAFGAVAFGIGTSQVRDVLASQCLAMEPMKIRRIRLTDERMTICNMSIEGGARVGYVNPDDTTFEYINGRPFAPSGDAFERAKRWWRAMASDRDASYDDDVEIRAEELTPVVTWGVNPGQSIGIDGRVPSPDSAGGDRQAVSDALDYMGLRAGQPIAGMKVDVAFIGSCTNSRLSDLREAARIVRGHHVAPHVKALVVPGSVSIGRAAEKEGIHEIFREAGFEWRGAGCSMCLGMNPDKLEGNQVCASSSNRNFKGRQGSPTGRTLLMSPAMVAAAALTGEVTDVRRLVN
jgi:3-isopropylmalate/(R)-2-methylmalate dehydratase large subunit